MADRPAEDATAASRDSRWATPLARRLRGIVWDSSSGVPSLSAVIDTVRRELEPVPALGILFVRLEQWGAVSHIFSWRELAGLFAGTSRLIDEMLGKELRQIDLPADLGQGEGVAIVLSPPRGGGVLDTGHLEVVAERVAGALRAHFAGSLNAELHERVTVDVGSGLIPRPAGELTLEECLVSGLVAAAETAERKQRERVALVGAELSRSLAAGELQVRYQPVVDLTARRLVGFQASAEGPYTHGLQHPDVLFDVAERLELAHRLYDVYQQTALGEPAAQLRSDELLFLRATATDLVEAGVRVTSALYGLSGHTLSPGNIVFLLPATGMLSGFAPVLASVRSVGEMGFRVAVDLDPGCAPSLDHLRELQPDYLRLSGRSVRLVASQPDEFELLLMTSRFAGRNSMQLLAADCLERAEILALKRAGVRLASGSYLAPATPRPSRPELHLP